MKQPGSQDRRGTVLELFSKPPLGVHEKDWEQDKRTEKLPPLVMKTGTKLLLFEAKPSASSGQARKPVCLRSLW